MFNRKQSKSSLTNAFMATAIAFVLVMGTGYSSSQSFGLDYNGIGNLDMFNGFTQSAECGGLGNDCSEDNRVTNNIPSDGNGNGEEPTPEPTCEEAVEVIIRLAGDVLTNEQLAELEIALLDRCEDGASPEDLIDLLLDADVLPEDIIQQIIEELDLDIALPN